VKGWISPFSKAKRCRP